jgi:hypothetical protein
MGRFDGPKPGDPDGGNAWIRANIGRRVYAVTHGAGDLPELRSARIVKGSYVSTILDDDIGGGPSFFTPGLAIAHYVARTRAEAEAARCALDLAERRLAVAATLAGGPDLTGRRAGDKIGVPPFGEAPGRGAFPCKKSDAKLGLGRAVELATNLITPPDRIALRRSDTRPAARKGRRAGSLTGPPHPSMSDHDLPRARRMRATVVTRGSVWPPRMSSRLVWWMPTSAATDRIERPEDSTRALSLGAGACGGGLRRAVMGLQPWMRTVFSMARISPTR